MIILLFNHNKNNNINPYLFKIVYIPLIFIIFIISDKSLDLIINFYIFFCLYFDLSILYFGGPFDYLLVKPKGSGAVSGPNGNNNGPHVTTYGSAYGTVRPEHADNIPEPDRGSEPADSSFVREDGSYGPDEIILSTDSIANTLEQQRNDFLGRQSPKFGRTLNPTLNQLGYNFHYKSDVDIKRFMFIQDNVPDLFNPIMGSTKVNPEFIANIRSLRYTMPRSFLNNYYDK
jgi:hypothetical protein